MRANTTPSARDLGLVTWILLNIQCHEYGYMSDDVAGTLNDRPYLMGDVMAAFVEGSAAIFPDRADAEEARTGSIKFEV